MTAPPPGEENRNTYEMETAVTFGGPEQLRDALERLQSLLRAARARTSDLVHGPAGLRLTQQMMLRTMR